MRKTIKNKLSKEVKNMNRLEEIRNRDLKPPNKISKIEEIKSLFLDNYGLWAFLLIGVAIILAYPKTVVSFLGLLGCIPSGIYDIISSLPFPLILVIIALVIFVAGYLRKPKGRRPVNRF